MDHWTERLFVDDADLYLPELLAVEPQGDDEVAGLLARLAEWDVAPDSVLDVGCGIGRHARAFAERDVEATGVDISPAFLDRAREQARQDGVADRTDFRQLDMRSLADLDRRFDLAVCLYNTFGYFDEAENSSVLEGMRERLTEDGVCAIQVGNKDALLADFPDSRVREIDGGMIVEQYEFESRTSRLRRTRDVFRGDSSSFDHAGRTQYEVRSYSPPELDRVLRNAGFEEVRLFGGYEGDPLESDADRILALAR